MSRFSKYLKWQGISNLQCLGDADRSGTPSKLPTHTVKTGQFMRIVHAGRIGKPIADRPALRVRVMILPGTLQRRYRQSV